MKDMTLREYYAGLAMQGMLASGDKLTIFLSVFSTDDYIHNAFFIADGMIKQASEKQNV